MSTSNPAALASEAPAADNRPRWRLAAWIAGGIAALVLAAVGGAQLALHQQPRTELTTAATAAPPVVAQAQQAPPQAAPPQAAPPQTAQPQPMQSAPALADNPAPSQNAMNDSGPAAPPTPPAHQAGEGQIVPVEPAPPPAVAAAPRHRAPAATHSAARDAGRSVPSRSQTVAAACIRCGTVEAVTAHRKSPPASGAGAVTGGVLGGVVGNQFGSGGGRAAMTILGAIGGGVAGNKVENNMNAETFYRVRVRMDNGGERTLEVREPPGVGERVTISGNRWSPA